ncbi:hypothetical protein PILCRDRAFT_823348 [Piloderma croceum F 1598]|uniref:HNH nuclease domain-containing protein n=1 Tax=Piloderma croceum (strain F 1598) TaxID=765440 RepID=A0A0C3FIB5_PILCF|nr:hypothetical protein PILCRDRAFT_823348 [Piloderma croceum F 1598]
MQDLNFNNPFPAGTPDNLAYQRAFTLATAYPRRDRKAMCGRVLGYMLQELPWCDGRSKMASEVNSCVSEQHLVDLGMFYINHFLRSFRSAKGPTPAPSEHPSRPSFDDERDMNSDVIAAAQQDHRTSKKQALRRDGYRCMLSGKVDSASVLELRSTINAATVASLDAHDAAMAAAASPSDSKLAEKAADLAKESTALDAVAERADTILANLPNPPTLCVTNAAHIFSESTNTDLGNDTKKDYASSFWAVMERFGQQGFMDELNGPKIHRLANILTLEVYLHTHFDRLALWLEADDTKQQTYRICSSDNDIIRDLPRTVIFAKYANFDLPDSRYLKMHAACCRVAHMSGAAGYLDDIMDDLDEGRTKVLSEDGSSSRILDFALLISSGRRIAAH